MNKWLSLLFPFAIYNIIKRSTEHGQENVVGMLRGSAPYYPPEDNGTNWVKTNGDPLEHQRVIRYSNRPRVTSRRKQKIK